MKYTFRLSQTASARKSFRVSKELREEMKRAGKLVAEGEIPGIRKFTLGAVAMSDEELLQLNNDSLGHDWYTDIITFELEREVDSENVTSTFSLEAEVYVSVDRAAENARKARVSLEEELVHLVIHGVLHLAGYDDHDPAKKKQMVRKERMYLAQVFPERRSSVRAGAK